MEERMCEYCLAVPAIRNTVDGKHVCWDCYLGPNTEEKASMSARVYGASDDLIEFEGDFTGEASCFDQGVLVVMSDGTLLEVKYGKNDKAIWQVTLRRQGTLLDRIDQCDDEDADPYSDVAHFKDGIKWAYAAKGAWEEVK